VEFVPSWQKCLNIIKACWEKDGRITNDVLGDVFQRVKDETIKDGYSSDWDPYCLDVSGKFSTQFYFKGDKGKTGISFCFSFGRNI